MKFLIILILIATAGYYYFNQPKPACETFSDVQDRAYELAKAFMHASTAKNSDLTAKSILQKTKKLESMKKEGFPDIPRACELMDEMMDELDY